MRDFKRKKGIGKFFQSKLALFLFGVFIIFFAWNVFGFIGKMSETSKNRRIAEMKVVELKEMKEKLTEDINSLSTEKGQEESIREKFGFVKEGEEVIVIVEEKSELDKKEEEKDSKFLNFLRNWFK